MCICAMPPVICWAPRQIVWLTRFGFVAQSLSLSLSVFLSLSLSLSLSLYLSCSLSLSLSLSLFLSLYCVVHVNPGVHLRGSRPTAWLISPAKQVVVLALFCAPSLSFKHSFYHVTAPHCLESITIITITTILIILLVVFLLVLLTNHNHTTTSTTTTNNDNNNNSNSNNNNNNSKHMKCVDYYRPP